jgi:hypothetical protein
VELVGDFFAEAAKDMGYVHALLDKEDVGEVVDKLKLLIHSKDQEEGNTIAGDVVKLLYLTCNCR